MIGQSPSEVPYSVSIDLGVTDAFITEYGRSIKFGGDGEKTDVGKRIDKTTAGMSIPGSDALDVDDFPGRRTTGRPAKRIKKAKRRTGSNSLSSWENDPRELPTVAEMYG
jgi:hypothetical protein